MGALSGLGGYMTLGLGAKTIKPCALRIKDNEVLIAKDRESFSYTRCLPHAYTFIDNGLFINVDGKPSRTAAIDWPAPPEDTGS